MVSCETHSFGDQLRANVCYRCPVLLGAASQKVSVEVLAIIRDLGVDVRKLLAELHDHTQPKTLKQCRVCVEQVPVFVRARNEELKPAEACPLYDQSPLASVLFMQSWQVDNMRCDRELENRGK